MRNLSRVIWISVALPPIGDGPVDTKGKTPTSMLTPAQLRRRKVDAIKLTLAFAYAVKHYLREEDGLGWDDYKDVVPSYFYRMHTDPSRTRSGSVAASYHATEMTQNAGSSRSTSPDGVRPESSVTSLGATKRVRVKRSVDKLLGSKTPLLADDHRTLDFTAYTEAPIPLPLLSVIHR